jgi:hypothetical protein
MLRYAPINEPSSVSSPRVVNPYKSYDAAPVHIPTNEDVESACHDYLGTVYRAHGIGGVLRLMEPEMLRDLKAAVSPHSGLHVHLGLEEIAAIMIGLFLLVVLMD